MKSCSNFHTERLSRNSNLILPHHHLLALDLCENNQNGYKIQLSSKRNRNHNFCICRDDHCCTSCTFQCFPDLQFLPHLLHWLDPHLPPDCWLTDTNKNLKDQSQGIRDELLEEKRKHNEAKVLLEVAEGKVDVFASDFSDEVHGYETLVAEKKFVVAAKGEVTQQYNS